MYFLGTGIELTPSHYDVSQEMVTECEYVRFFCNYIYFHNLDR